MSVLKQVEDHLLPFAQGKSEDCSVGNVLTGKFSLPVREFFEKEPIIQQWLQTSCPDDTGYRLATGCDPLSASAIDVEYTQTEQCRDLIERRLFVFAVDGSGYGYTLCLDSGKVYLLLGAWGGDTDTNFESAVIKEWATIKEFVAYLQSKE